MKKLSATFATLLIATHAQWASADGLKSLESFMQGVQTGRADFTQTVTSPPRDGQAARTKTSSGTFEFQRPNRFKFIYQKPFAQSIVADGQTLWLYDVDLNQVTQRPQAKALGSTPATLLAAAPDLQALRAEFTLESAPVQDDLDWVLARPKAKEGQLQSVRLGFSLAQGQLAALEILDSFGQRSVIRFAHLQINPPFSAGTFQFKPPAGADVVRP